MSQPNPKDNIIQALYEALQEAHGLLWSDLAFYPDGYTQRKTDKKIEAALDAAKRVLGVTDMPSPMDVPPGHPGSETP